jgi:predicted nucleic acid-binding protein
MASVLFDTSIFIAYKPVKLPANFLVSAVVIQELAAGAADNSVLQGLQAVQIAYEKEGKLLVPSGEDWWLAGKVLNSLFRGLKSTSKGRTRRITKHEQQRIIRDVLIARSVKRANALLVTNNVSDFVRIRQFCKVNFLSGLDYFKR